MKELSQITQQTFAVDHKRVMETKPPSVTATTPALQSLSLCNHSRARFHDIPSTPAPPNSRSSAAHYSKSHIVRRKS